MTHVFSITEKYIVTDTTIISRREAGQNLEPFTDMWIWAEKKVKAIRVYYFF